MYHKCVFGAQNPAFLLDTVIASFYLFVCLLKCASVKSPILKRIEPPTKGKPAPTKSSILADQRNGKQNNIPKSPANIVIIANAFNTVLIDLSVICVLFYIEFPLKSNLYFLFSQSVAKIKLSVITKLSLPSKVVKMSAPLCCQSIFPSLSSREISSSP